MFKSLIQSKLEKSVTHYFQKHPEVKLVVVAGSVGKTSTKVAIATVLNEKYRVRLHEGNHNSEVSAPLAMLGVDFPTSLRNPLQWVRVLQAVKARINSPTDVDVIIQEIGTEHSGEIPHFGTYLNPDIAVISAISPEHMEFFKTMDAVAQEELSAANFSKLALINRDDIPSEYAKYITNSNLDTYGTSANAEYHFIEQTFDLQHGHVGHFVAPEWSEGVEATIRVVGEHNVRPAIAAGAVGVKLGMNAEEIARGLEKVHAVAGRMNMLQGLENSTILDDSYNSSPLAATSALQALYSLTAPIKIAVLGSMNELGETSIAEHQTIGKLCDPVQLAWVITVGDEAEKYLAPAAKSRGCSVMSFKTALQAGAFVHKVLETSAVVLFKGSQGGIYLEEAIKVILHNTEDEAQLVRQSPAWMVIKEQFFAQFQAPSTENE